MKKDIRKYNLEALTDVLSEMGEKPFRARQIYEWLWEKSATEFDAMTNLSKDLRTKLSEVFEILNVAVAKSQYSEDGTAKYVFKLHDDTLVEGVLIPTPERATACISSQVGCSLNCKFCATGYMKRVRNLDAAEIYDQVVLINQQSLELLGRPLTNIVFMGMGEPLLNYKNVLTSINRITSPDGLHMSPRRITVSTAGIAKMIRKLADDKVKFNLALSLHAANDEKRNGIMPINEQNNIEILVDALNYFYRETRNKITFEYILLNGVNDTMDDARELIALCRRVPAKVNLIEYNPIDQADFNKTKVDERDAFISYLEKHRVTAKVRKSRGKDIDAACGQLANKLPDGNL
ncbi:MAG: 23S rRNA (adenine(2503)-C(2))-methyltransferase RlmN [Bacteroidetes bacterium]|nr:23S rRNA (adenine(2503)-C(2))-methyltransferase RlmN [Bacteroidota bacterium]